MAKVSVSWDSPSEITDDLFGEVRSALQELSNFSPSHMFWLLRQGAALSPQLYDARWRPYLMGYQARWPKPLLEVSTGPEVTRAGGLLSGASISVRPWRHTLGDAGAAQILASPAMSDVCQLHLRDQGITLVTIQALTHHDGLDRLEVLDLTRAQCDMRALETLVRVARLPALRVLRLGGATPTSRLRDMLHAAGWALET